MKDLTGEGFHYITAITKPQIENLMYKGLIQMDLFDEEVVEIQDGGMGILLQKQESLQTVSQLYGC